MSKPPKYVRQPRSRVSAFMQGQTDQIIILKIDSSEIRHLAELIQSTGEVFVDDAIKVVLMGIASNPPSQLMMLREIHKNFLKEFTERIEGVYKRRLSDAEEEADTEIMKFLLERGVTE